MATSLSRLRLRGGARGVEASLATVRVTAQGEVVGLAGSGGAHVWRGIPYADSTGGANRWRAPQPALDWEGRRPCLEFAERCAQLTNQGDKDDGIKPGLVIGSEDCLALDIYAPPTAQGRALPVMVWIHGGQNVWGRSGMYDGSTLAVREDVIVVIPQYRVGLLGWFAHPALRTAADASQDAAASFAILDLIAALRWVRANITAFGGDPGCVTIFGESSGGHNVAMLLASPQAEGLFHRAIIQSGSFDSVPREQAEGAEDGLRNPSNLIARRLHATTAADLRSATVEQLYAACEVGESWFVDVPRAIQDGVAIPATPLRDAFTSTSTFHPVPMILGSNRDEMKLFFASRPDMTTKKLGVLPVPRDPALYDATSRYISRVWRIRAVDEPAQAMIDAGHEQVYAYRFDWDDGGRLLAMDFQELFGAAHGFEIPFVFGRFTHLGDADRFLFQKRTLRDRQRLSHAMSHYWATFARDGKPACPDQPEWPLYQDEGGTYLRLDTANDGGIRVERHADSIDTLATDLNGNPALNDTQRRSIVDEMDNWMFTRPVQATVRTAQRRVSNGSSVKAIVQLGFGSPAEVLELRELDTPQAAKDAVLVRVHAASIHIGDVHGIRGLPKVMRPIFGSLRAANGVVGTDIAGTVAAIGDDVVNLRPGDEVFGTAKGAFAEYAVAKEDQLVAKPTGLTFEQAAAIGVSATTALQALRDHGKVRAGQRVLITGASGGVGTFAVQIARSLGATVTGVCSTPNIDMVRSIGADHVIDYTQDDYTQGDHEYDLIMDNVGNHSLRTTRRALAADGVLIPNSAGAPRGWFGGLGRPLQAAIVSLFVKQQGRGFVSTQNTDDLAALGKLAATGTITPVIDRTYSLTDGIDALRHVAAGHAQGTTVITMTA